MSVASQQAFFLSGTDTGIGKTIVGAWLALHWQAEYWKPIQSGLEDATDSQTVAALAHVKCHPEAYRLQAPLSPHQSAALEGITIDAARIRLPMGAGIKRLIVEGAGGLMVPINDSHLMINLIAQLRLSTLLVARTGLGTINHTLLSVEALRIRKLPIMGIVMCGDEYPANRAAIERYGNVPVLDCLPRMQAVNTASLQQHQPSAALLTALHALPLLTNDL